MVAAYLGVGKSSKPKKGDLGELLGGMVPGLVPGAGGGSGGGGGPPPFQMPTG